MICLHAARLLLRLRRQRAKPSHRAAMKPIGLSNPAPPPTRRVGGEKRGGGYTSCFGLSTFYHDAVKRASQLRRWRAGQKLPVEHAPLLLQPPPPPLRRARRNTQSPTPPGTVTLKEASTRHALSNRSVTASAEMMSATRGPPSRRRAHSRSGAERNHKCLRRTHETHQKLNFCQT